MGQRDRDEHRVHDRGDMKHEESEFMRRLRAKVEAEIAPVVRLFGDDAPVVRAALGVLKSAEEIEAQLASEWVPTARASELTGYDPKTLQVRAKAVLAG